MKKGEKFMMYKVVIIDDNRIVVQSIEKSIDWNALGCTVAGTVYDGIAGRQLIHNVKPNIVITDIMMPGFDGLEMIKNLRTTDSKIKFIMITGYSNFEYARQSIKLGVFDFILKPIDNDELIEAIANAVHTLNNEPALEEEWPEDSLEYSVAKIKSAAPQYSALIRETLAYIDENIFNGISLRKVCDKYLVSASHLSGCFKKETGKSFVEYVNSVKMCKAKALLKNPRNKVYEVGLMLGYKDYVYFYQVFKRYCGYSPSDLK
jgi:two-component system response regulator YesN